MLGKRLCRFFLILNWLNTNLGVIAGKYSKTTGTFKYDPTLEWKVKVNYNWYFLWAIGGFCKVVKYLLQSNDVNLVNVTFSFWLTSTIGLLLFSVLRWFPHDICIMTNGFINLMSYIHRKFSS